EVAYRLSPEGRLDAVMNPGGRRLVIDAHRDTMILGERRVRIEPEFLLFRDGLLYVGAERLGDLFSTPILVDWTDLTVAIVDPTVFPAGLRAQRQAAREAFLRRVELQSAELALPAERRRLDGPEPVSDPRPVTHQRAVRPPVAHRQPAVRGRVGAGVVDRSVSRRGAGGRGFGRRRGAVRDRAAGALR